MTLPTVASFLDHPALVGHQADKPFVVNFTAPWCGPCKVATPIIKRLVAEREDRFTLVHIDIVEEPVFKTHFHLETLPCMILLHLGNEVARISGPDCTATETLTAWLDHPIPQE